MSDLSTDAINAALASDWKKAVELNNQILKSEENNIDCLNRLGKAYLELGDIKKACTILRKVLKINKYDAIAQRNLAKAEQGPVKKSCIKATSFNHVINFLEEPGKTKLISLVNLAPTHELLKHSQTEEINLVPKRHTVVAIDTSDKYLGSLPDDVGHRLLVLIKGGNKYCCIIKSVSKGSMIIFVREVFRAKKLLNTPSFITNNADYFSYVREETATDTPHPVDVDSDDDLPMGEKLHADEEDSNAQD